MHRRWLHIFHCIVPWEKPTMVVVAVQGAPLGNYFLGVIWLCIFIISNSLKSPGLLFKLS